MRQLGQVDLHEDVPLFGRLLLQLVVKVVQERGVRLRDRVAHRPLLFVEPKQRNNTRALKTTMQRAQQRETVSARQ